MLSTFFTKIRANSAIWGVAFCFGTAWFQSASAQEYTPMTRLGLNPLCKPPIQSGEDLQQFFAENEDVVREVLSISGWTGEADQLLEAVANGDFVESEMPVGSTLEWMGTRRGGKVMTLPKRVWQGAEPYGAFTVNLAQNCEVHEIVIPKDCCNVSLAKITESATPPPALDVQQAGDCNSDKVTIDLSNVEEGAAVSVTVTGPDGSTQTLAPEATNGGYSVETMLEGAGSYLVAATVEGACGPSPAANSTVNVATCPEEPEPKMAYIPYIAPFIGYERRTRNICGCEKTENGTLAGLLGGVQFPFTNGRGDLLLQAGAAANLDNNGYSTLFADVGADFNVGEKGFVGAGVGVWDINDSSETEGTLFLHGGADTPWKVGSGKVQWFVEGRTFFDDFGDDYVGLAGLRMILKE